MTKKLPAAKKTNGATRVPRFRRECEHVNVRHVHGTSLAYVSDRCRCGPCTEANRRYERARDLKKLRGQDRLVDAAPVRAHVEGLRAQGMGVGRIAAVSGVHPSVIGAMLWGSTGRPPTSRLQARNAARLLATRVDHADRHIEERPGAVRRLQGLQCMGWSLTIVAGYAGLATDTLQRMLRDDSRAVTDETAARIAAAYRVLTRRLPPERNQRERNSANRARNRAAAAGWPSPAAWDEGDLDDPAARPQVDEPRPGPQERIDVDEVDRLVRSGMTTVQIAYQLGCSRRSVDRIRTRRRPGTEVAA